MTVSGFAEGQAWSVLEGLRPEAGVELDHLAVATYSLDLVAVAALILSLGAGREEELRAGPLEFADAVRTMKSKIVILHQKGQMTSPGRYRDVLHMLDGTIRAVVPERGASWHPKAILGRYVGPRNTPSWRLWLGSRNLTGGRDREAGLLLIGAPARSERPAGTASALQSLFAGADWTTDQLAELDRVRWTSPDGVKLLSLNWRSLGTTRRLIRPLPRAHTVLVISPFTDPGGMAELQDARTRKLLTTAMDAVDFAHDDRLQVRVAGTRPHDEPMDVPDCDEDGAPAARQSHSLHAKLILLRSGSANRLWIGSANATRRGLNGPNAELMAELEVSSDHAEALERYWMMSAESAEVPEVDQDAAALEAAELRLDEALCDLLAINFRIEKTVEGLKLIGSHALGQFLKGHRLFVSLMTLPDEEVEWPAGAEAVIIGGCETPIRLQTVLVSFRARARMPPNAARRWTQPVEFPGLDIAARDRAALAAYIGPTRFAAWLRAQLEGIETGDPGDRTWAGEPKPQARSAGAGPASRPFTLETVLASWARDPDAFAARVAEIDGVLQAFVEEVAGADEAVSGGSQAMLKEVMPFWIELRASLQIGAVSGA
jgi:hypothetical protein